MTNDLDIVVEVTGAQAGQLVTDFSQNSYYLPSLESLIVEIRRPNRGHCNLIDFKSGFKAD